MSYKGKRVIKGQITAIRDGEKRISRGYTYGYMVLSVQTSEGLYSILVSSAKINRYGFLPRVGQYILAEGIRSPSRDGFHDYSMSHLSMLEHIEPQ
ncbi:MAG: hypothetical protein EU542_05035 [Promethearchaeota archaeon]|nr:MAG: hypothetical protein EU542_05035 [Candidatus Lokiarchaeota archaeon]